MARIALRTHDTLPGMDTSNRHTASGAESRSERFRGLFVVARWALALIGIGVATFLMLAGDPGIVGRVFGFLLLAVLLANALWQHLPLGRACVSAFAVAGLLAIALELFRGEGTMQLASIVIWLFDAGGAALGAALAYMVMPKIDAATKRML